MLRNHFKCAVAAITILIAGSALASDRISAVTRFLSVDGAPLPANWHANPDVPAFLVIHGFTARGTDASSIAQAAAIRKRFPQAIVVIVDWTVPAPVRSPEARQSADHVGAFDLVGRIQAFSAEYQQAVHAARGVGRDIADWMKREGIGPSRTVLCGHSLGAQIAGFAGKYVARSRISGHKIQTILAADPAGPSFAGAIAEERLDKSDADEVIVVHTTDFLGDNHAIGTLDIYVTWSQPDTPDIITQHCMARELVTRSFANPDMVTNAGLPFAANAIGCRCRSDKAQGFVIADENPQIAAR